MNGGKELAGQMMDALQPVLVSAAAEVAICPPFTLLQHLGELTEGSPVSLGAQNVYHQNSGAFTGEVSPPMLLEWGLKWCIVGHSERRSLCGETDDLVRQKVVALLQHGIQPILCVGEALEQREAGKHEDVVTRQLRHALTGLNADDQRLCVIAYEPIWAIGTGKTACPDQANKMHGLIRRELVELSSERIASEVRILYGGSVNATNAKDLLGQPEIDGALVGGASLKIHEFPGITAAAG